MLLDIRETIRGSKPLKYTLITIISIPFVLVGIGSYLGGGGYEDVAEVDGVAINQPQLDNAYNQLKRQYSQMFGGNIPENLMPDEAIRQQALDGLVTDIVVRNTVEEQKFAVGDLTLGRAIRNDQRFQVDGVFDPEVYQNHVRGSLSNVAAYEESLRANAAITQFRAGISATSFQLPNEVERIEKLSGQTRTIDYVRYSIDSAVENVEVSDEEISAHFDENADSYKFPQRAKLEYIELKKSDLAADIDVSDEEAQNYYDEFQANYTTNPEVREASHILMEVDVDDNDAVDAKTKELSAIKARIAAGEAFADLAKEFSDDIGSAQSGGSVGQIDANYMEPQFVSAATGLTAEGDLSSIVRTRFGLHLIQLDKLVPAVVTPFEEAKDLIVTQLKNDAADVDFLELRTAMEESVSSDPETLEVAADQSNTEIKQTDWVDVDTQNAEVFSNPQVLATVFSDDVLVNQNNSEVLEVGPGHILALRILEYEDERPKTLEDVKDDISAELKREGGEAKLEESAKAAVAKMLKGTPVAKVAEDDPNATATANEVLTRTSTVIDPSAVSEIFALAKPAEGKTLVKSVAMQNGDRVAYALKAVTDPEPTEEEGAADATVTVNPALGQSELAALIASLREKADVSLNQ